MKKKIFLLALSLLLAGVGCVKEEKKEESKILELVKEGDRISVVSNDEFMGGEFIINKKLSKEQIVCSDDKLEIVLLEENKTVVTIASKYNEIKSGDTVFSINGDDEGLIVESRELLGSKSVVASNVRGDNILLGDFDGNKMVNLVDFVKFKESYGGKDIKYDIAPASKGSGIWSNIYSTSIPDGDINLKDFVVFANNYGKAEPKISEESFFINVNFQKEGAEAPLDYLADTGLPFGDRGDGNRYGWSNDISKGGRNRNHTSSKDERYDTLLHMKHEDQGYDAFWEIELPNGNYSVRVVAGDPEYADGYYKISVEGQLIIDGEPTYSNKYFDELVSVEVKDGRLTLATPEDAGATKIAFVEIMYESESGDTYAPSMIYNMSAREGDTQMYLSWDNPLYDLEGVLVLTSESPIEEVPTQGVDYEGKDSLGNTEISYIGPGNQRVLTGLENDKMVYVKVFTFDKLFNYSEGVESSATPYKMTATQNRENSEIAMEELQPGNSPEVVYDIFNGFDF